MCVRGIAMSNSLFYSKFNLQKQFSSRFYTILYSHDYYITVTILSTKPEGDLWHIPQHLILDIQCNVVYNQPDFQFLFNFYVRRTF